MGAKPKKKLRVVELYAGTGRSVEPFRSWRKAEISLLVDISQHAQRTYLHNFPGAPYKELDLEAESPEDVIRHAGGRIDVLLGCPPCQGFSESGRRDPKDKRNKHLSIFSEVALRSRPRAIAMENVPMAAASREFGEMTKRLEEIGYQWSAAIVNSAQFGSCQSRQRLLFVAFAKSVNAKPKFPRPTHGRNMRIFSYGRREYQQSSESNVIEMLGITPASQRVAKLLPQNILMKIGDRACPTVEDTIDDLPLVNSENAMKIQHVRWRHGATIQKRMANIPEGSQWSGAVDHYAHTYGRLHRHGLSRTITASFPYAGGGRYWHPQENRSLTLREAARIQGFPDTFKFLNPVSTKENAQLVGNALDAHLSKVIHNVIRKGLKK